MNENKCYFPVDVSIEKEYTPGLGKKEMRGTVKGSFAVLVLSIIFYMSFSNLLSSMIMFTVGSIGCGMFCIRNHETNISIVDEIKNLVSYIKAQKVFLFQYSDEWRELNENDN
ncbi:hypothetical protein [Ruminococcus sp. Marseille-P6503]|uniref:hypothetical protein n=1 Tax=Ruminococcus sp. Marseille-P6503 TaxID=2364796 RepID=UPI000F525447|nr:hypothetical protein [Ruminococcus sp. Marseille-P6503]